MLPLLLSSKALPEMDAERTELLQMHGMAAGTASAPERFQSLTVSTWAQNPAAAKTDFYVCTSAGIQQDMPADLTQGFAYARQLQMLSMPWLTT